MSDAVEKYLEQKAVTEPKVIQNQTGANSGFETFIGGLFTPFRWGVETLTAALIQRQSSNMSWEEAKDIADGDRTGKAWWEEGSNKVTTLGQASIDALDPSKVDYAKLQKQQEKFQTGPRKYLSGGIDFLASIFLDPTNFLTVGGGAALKAGLVGGTIGKLRRLGSERLLAADSFKNVDEFFTVAQQAVKDSPTPESVLLKGTQEYELGIEQLRPYFRQWSESFKSIPQIKSKKGLPFPDVTYLAVGPSAFAIRGNTLLRLSKGKWEEEVALSKSVFNYLDNAPTSLYAHGFTPGNPQSFERNVPTIDGTLLPENTVFGFGKDVDGNLVEIAITPSVVTPDAATVPPQMYILNRQRSLDFDATPAAPIAVENVRQIDELTKQFAEWEAISDIAQRGQFSSLSQIPGIPNELVEPFRVAAKELAEKKGSRYKYYYVNDNGVDVLYARTGEYTLKTIPQRREVTERLEDGSEITETIVKINWTRVKKPKLKEDFINFKNVETWDPDPIYSYDDLERRRSALLREEEAVINREAAYQPTYAGLDESFGALDTLRDDILENKAEYKNLIDDLEDSLKQFEEQLKSEGLSPKKIKELVDRRRNREMPVYKPVVPDEDSVLAKIEEARSSEIPAETLQEIPEDLVARGPSNMTEADFIARNEGTGIANANTSLDNTVDDAAESLDSTVDEVAESLDNTALNEVTDNDELFQFTSGTSTSFDQHVLDLQWQPISAASVDSLIESFQVKYINAFGDAQTAFIPPRFARFIEPNSIEGDLRVPKFIEDETGDIYTFSAEGRLVPEQEAIEEFDALLIKRQEVEEAMIERAARYWKRWGERNKEPNLSDNEINIWRNEQLQSVRAELQEFRSNPRNLRLYKYGKVASQVLEPRKIFPEQAEAIAFYGKITRLQEQEAMYVNDIAKARADARVAEAASREGDAYERLYGDAEEVKTSQPNSYLETMWKQWFFDEDGKTIPIEFSLWFKPSIVKLADGKDSYVVELMMKRTDYDTFGPDALITGEPLTNAVGRWTFANPYDITYGARDVHGINPFIYDKETKQYLINPYFTGTIGIEDNFTIYAHELDMLGVPRLTSGKPAGMGQRDNWFEQLQIKYSNDIARLIKATRSEEYVNNVTTKSLVDGEVISYRKSIDDELEYLQSLSPHYMNEEAYLQGWMQGELRRPKYAIYNERKIANTLVALNQFSSSSQVSKRTLMEYGLDEDAIKDVLDIDQFFRMIKGAIGTGEIESRTVKYLDELSAFRAGETDVAPRVMKKSKLTDETPKPKKTVTPKRVFVFGSNLAGRHGKGAALTAKNEYGAVYGQGVGLQGQAYGIPTKGNKLEKLTPEEIKPYVDEFIAFVKANPETEFGLTDIGLGLADNKPEAIAALFDEVPSNIRFITNNSKLKAALEAAGKV